jgi:hypothetical protein
MASKKTPFMKTAQMCPVVGHAVNLSGILVALSGFAEEVAHKNCSNVEECLAKHGDIEHIPACLLRTLRP